MSTPEKSVDTESRDDGSMRRDESRFLWLAILHAVVMIRVAIIKYLKIEGRCEHCGNKL